METVRFGLIGYGHCGAQRAAAVARTAGAQLVGVATPSAERQGAARAAHPQAFVCADYRELLDRTDVDIVCVSVPNSLHFAVGTNVLRAGKHLLLEKPLALNAADSDRLLALSRKQRRMLAVGHHFRVSSLWGGLRRLVQDGAVGRPLYAFFELARAPYRLGSGGWRYDPERVGSWIFEDSIHLFDMARWCLADRGEPLSVYARGNTRDPEHPELQDNFSCLVNFPDHVYALVSHTIAAFGYHVTAKVAGVRGAIWASLSAADPRDPNPTCSLLYGLGTDVRSWPLTKPVGEATEIADEIAILARGVREGIPPPCGGEDGRWSTLLGLAARESVGHGAEVSLAEFVARPDNLES